MQYKTLHNLFNTTPSLNKFVLQLEQMQQISQFLAQYLEPELSAQCRVANLREHTLILSTKSPAWHHKLRFRALDILSALRSQPAWCGLRAIEVRVDYLPNLEHDTTTNLKKPLTLSTYNAKLIAETANSVTCHKLAQALQRLSARTKHIKHEN